MSVARVIQPGQQTEMMPLFLLGAFGYPNYPGISETDNVSVFLFDSDEAGAAPFVILAKIGKESPIRQTVGSFQWAMEDRDGWLLLSKDKSNFDYIKNLEAFTAFNAQPGDFDIEARVFLGSEKVKAWASDIKEMIEQEHIVASQGKDAPMELRQKTRIVDFFAEGAQNLKWAEIGIDLSAETVSLGAVLEATEGTPEGQILSAPVGGKVPAAKYITSLGMLDYIGKLNPTAIATYYKVLQSRAQSLADDDEKPWLADFGKIMDSYIAMSDGTSAGSVVTEGTINRMMSINGGKYTDASIVESSKILYDKLMPELFAAIPYISEQGIDYTFTFAENVAEADGVPIHESLTVVEVQMPEMPEGQELTQELKDQLKQEQRTYFAVVGGDLISATQLSDMKILIAAVKGGKAVSGNISDTLSLKQGIAMAYRVDLAKYFTMGMASMPDTTPGAEQMKAVVSELQNAQLAPASGAISTGKNRLKATFSMPVSSLAKIAQAFQEMQPAPDETYQMQDDSPTQ